MKKEIRKEIREFILDEINLMLSRLGVNENVVETKEWSDKYETKLHYEFESGAIRQMPMMFKKLYVYGYMTVVSNNEGDRFFELADKWDIVVVNLSYGWKHFGGGSNGTDIGRVIFAVRKDLPGSLAPSKFGNPCEYCVRKLEGLTL